MCASPLEYARSQQNLLAVLLAAGAGLAVPAFESYTRPLLTPLVILLVYSSLRGLSLRELDPASFAVPTAISVGIGYMLLPIISVPVANIFVADAALTGLTIALAVPTTAGSAIVWTRFARGDEQLATIISITSLLLAPIVTPLLLLVLTSQQAAVPVQSILADILTIVAVSFILKGLLPTDTISDRTANYGSRLVIVLLIYSGVAGVDATSVSVRHIPLLVVASVGILVVGLAMSYILGRYWSLNRGAILPIFFTSSFKNLGIALLIASIYASALAVVAIVTYYITEQIVGAVTADFVTDDGAHSA